MGTLKWPTVGETGVSPRVSPQSTNRSGMFLPEDESGAISESERLRLVEEEEWKSAVARNRSVLDELYNSQRFEANGKGQPFSFRMPEWRSDEIQSTAGKTATYAPVKSGSARLGARMKAMRADLSERLEPLS